MAKIVDVARYAFNYQSVGNPAHFPILFLHGFMGDCHEFDTVISLLPNEFYCLAIDLPGHGKTKVTGAEDLYTMESTAQGIINFLDTLDINQCILIGYSMGGRLALYLALHFPQYFHKVILESASPGLKSPEEKTHRIQTDLKLARELENDALPSFLQRWYEKPLFASIRNHPDFSRMLARRLQNNPVELSKSLRQLSTGYQPSLWGKLPENSVPLLLIVGQLDEKFVNINVEMFNSCKFSHLELVDNCGHTIHLENPSLFVQKISRHSLL